MKTIEKISVMILIMVITFVFNLTSLCYAADDLDAMLKAVEEKAKNTKNATTKLSSDGDYQKPTINVTKCVKAFNTHKNVKKVQLKGENGSVYILKHGEPIPNIEPGKYVVSLYGSTFKEDSIYATVYYE